MTRRGDHWARYRVSVGIETAGFRPVKNPFRRDKRKTCRPRAISVTRCGSSSLSFWASKAVSVLIVLTSVSEFYEKMDRFFRRGEALSQAPVLRPAGPIGVTTLPDVAWYPSRLWINIPHRRRYRVRDDTVSPC